MYTQCPECLTAFRVTAALLQQASGRVRCGACGHAFNALEHLSEEPPPVEEAADTTPGGEEDPDALLDTFTDLSGFDDIRIEDTGVEWRVVDEDEEEPAAASGTVDGDETTSVRWFIADEDDETTADDAVPEVRDEVPAEERRVADVADSGILVEESGIREAAPAEDRQAELRYDDNTPLPDDVDDTAGFVEPELPRRRMTDHIEPGSPEFDERQSDLELGGPEDWRELLDEFGGEGDPGTATGDDSPAHALPADMDVPADIDTQFDLKALEMGINITGSRAVVPDDEAAPGPEDAPGDEALDLELETDTDVPAGGVDFDPGAPVQDIEFAVPADDRAEREPLDFDTGEERPAEEADFELAEAFEAERAPLDFDTGGESPAEETDLELAEAFEAEREPLDFDTGGGSPAEETDLELAEALEHADLSEHERHERDAAFAADGQAPPDPLVPPQTEEERTINMQIDQDLMRLAAEDGFGSTLTGERRMPEDLLVETIVMEGDFVRSALDKELDAVVDTVGADDDPRRLLDTYLKGKEEPVRGGRRRTDPPGYTVIAGVAVLGFVLIAQVVHAYRESLATYEAFDRTIGSVYRLFGQPLVPLWDVRGWRFEATSGSTDAADEVLTIRSRISNQSGGPLPYPLLHVALTDRFEEIIGSRVLQPADFLPRGAATERPVAAGEEFDATITVESVTAEATGFKLNVCYREDAARLRCATEDFRN